MAIDNISNNDKTRLSGAYIRSLVKQISSTKGVNTSSDQKNSVVGVGMGEIVHKSDKLSMNKKNNQHGCQQIGYKKQVRRRLHTSRPYQERLVNMAEARKEIVTALKYHRAAMKQANERQQSLPPQPGSGVHPSYQCNELILRVQDFKTCIPRNKQPSNLFTTNQYHSSSDSRSNSNINYSSYPTLDSYPWCNSLTSTYDNLSLPLPKQPLGLNLNLQAFTNLDTALDSPTKSHHYSSSSSTSTSTSISSPSSSSSTPLDQANYSNTQVGPTGGNHGHDNNVTLDHMHQALDEEEMAKIRSIGEQHQIEWDDTLNLVKSACWLKFLKKMELGKEKKGVEDMNIGFNYNDVDNKNNDKDYHNYSFGELMEFPSWLSGNESFCQQHLEDHCGQDNATLPWVDIGDIDGTDDEWLS